MPDYLNPSSVEGTLLWNNYGSGASTVARVNSISSPDTANGIETTIGEGWANPGPAHFKLTAPTLGVSTASTVSIKAHVGALFIAGTGDVTYNLTLRQGGISGTLIASTSGTRTPDTPITYGGLSYDLSAPEKALVTNWGDLYLTVDVLDIPTGERSPRITDLGIEYTEGSSAISSTRKRSHLLLMGCG